MGHVLIWGLHFSGTGSWIPEGRMVTLEQAGRSLSELEEEDALQRELFSQFPSHWREFVVSDIPRNFIHLWWDVPDYWHNYSIAYVVGRRIPYLLLLGLALPQLLRTIAGLARHPAATLDSMMLEVSALTLIALYTAVYSLFGAFHARYRFPIELGLIVLAGATLRPVVENILMKWVFLPAARRRLERVSG
jgi:hypothetical protein